MQLSEENKLNTFEKCQKIPAPNLSSEKNLLSTHGKQPIQKRVMQVEVL